MLDESTILNHLGENREDYFNAVSPPIIQSSNFCFPDLATMRERLTREFEEPFYTRGYNPTVGILRQKLAALEKSEDALVFASGSAAVAAAVMSVVKGGDHAICVKKPYSWTDKLLNKYLVDYGIQTTMVDGTKTENFETAIQENTKLIFLESPNSITMELQDIEAVCKIARNKGITTAIDNSFSSPLFQKPIEMGVDIVVHSASKYLNGHSDVVAGVLCSSKKRVEKIMASEFMTLGGIISPNDAWLMMRGLRTLDIRVNRSADTAEKVIAFLEDHSKVEQVLSPASTRFAQKKLANKQMKRIGGLFSILINAQDIGQVETFCNSLNRFLMACSWGGHESLIFPTAALYNSQNYNNPDLPWNLIRIYVGLEDPDLLIDDLQQALAIIE